MSSKVYWRPLKVKGVRTGDVALKNALQKVFGMDSVYILKNGDATKLAVMEDLGIEGAAELRQALLTHGSIEVEISN